MSRTTSIRLFIQETFTELSSVASATRGAGKRNPGRVMRPHFAKAFLRVTNDTCRGLNGGPQRYWVLNPETYECTTYGSMWSSLADVIE